MATYPTPYVLIPGSAAPAEGGTLRGDLERLWTDRDGQVRGARGSTWLVGSPAR